MTIFEYAKQNKVDKMKILDAEAVLIDKYTDNEFIVLVYSLGGFFIETIIRLGEIIEIVPYQRGYKLKKSFIHEESS